MQLINKRYNAYQLYKRYNVHQIYNSMSEYRRSCGGQQPQVEAYKYVREKQLQVGASKGSHGMVVIQL
jgi:hypothetical protein